MEIAEWLRARRSRLLVLVLVPALAATGASAAALVQDPAARATAVVEIPSLVGSEGSPYTGGTGVDQYAEALVSAATGPAARRAAAEAAGLDPARVREGLEVGREAGSSRVELVYTAAPGEEGTASVVVEAVADRARSTLFGEPVEIAEAAVQSAQDAYDDASSGMSAVSTEAGYADARSAYSAQLSFVNSLRTQVAAAEGRENADDGPLREAAEEAEAGLERFRPVLARLDDLEGERDAAEDRLERAQERLDDARAQLAAADPARTTTTTTGTTARSAREVVVDVALPAAAVGLVLALLLVLLLEVARERRTARRRTGRGAAGSGAVDGGAAHEVGSAEVEERTPAGERVGR
ncbi:hypothetical protein [uncultured Pseudokineococcus sp.]|uniref:hypothetical protein n=1 Tax=uncultured Pseudokineococcus sp. TaxID=1642928 RepID=UPI0026059882|nr:hypothetical protein [uncultured Pseudokineococcus sp.]